MSHRRTEPFKRLLVTVMLLLVLGGNAMAEDVESRPIRLRVLSYNIHIGTGTDGKLNLERTAKAITALQPDLVALQEVDNQTKRTGGVDQTAELARLTGMHGRFGKAMDYQGGEYGEAVLSRWLIAETVVHALPADAGYESRAALAILVDIPGAGAIWFVGTHLDHTATSRQRLLQIEALDKALSNQRLPAVLAGDFNATPDSDEMKRIFGQWTDAGPALDQLTWPSENPTMRIDFVVYRPRVCWRVVESRVVEEKVVSDHRPILAVLEFVPNKADR